MSDRPISEYSDEELDQLRTDLAFQKDLERMNLAKEEEERRNLLPKLMDEFSRLSKFQYELIRNQRARDLDIRPEALDTIYEQAHKPKDGKENDGKRPHKPRKVGSGGIPFRILGIGDDGLAYFLDQTGRIHSFRPAEITKTKLIALAPIEFWDREFSIKGSLIWDDAFDYVCRSAADVDFDVSTIRGRGAWREQDGRLCYHDGLKTYGTYDESRIYQKKPRVDIGLDADPASDQLRERMFNAAALLTFETHADVTRLLSWSVLAPFCGALPWRPAGFLTGPSRSGKTTILSKIVKPLAMPVFVSGETTAAFIRQFGGSDALPVVIDEAEGDDDLAARRMSDHFALMRQSTSDDAPIIGKGSTGGNPKSYSTRNMYLYAAISPNVVKNADQNRMFVVDLVPPANNWAKVKAIIAEQFTPENCGSVRSLTWSKLQEIIDKTPFFAESVQEVAGYDTRLSLQDGILWSACWIVWKARIPEEKELTTWLEMIYKQKTPEEPRDDAQDMIDRLRDEVVQLFGKPGERYRIGDILDILVDLPPDNVLRTDQEKKPFRMTVSNYGVQINRERQLCIATHNAQLERMFGIRRYAKVLSRHHFVAEKSRNVGNIRSIVFDRSILGEEAPF